MTATPCGLCGRAIYPHAAHTCELTHVRARMAALEARDLRYRAAIERLNRCWNIGECAHCHQVLRELDGIALDGIDLEGAA